MVIAYAAILELLQKSPVRACVRWDFPDSSY